LNKKVILIVKPFTPVVRCYETSLSYWRRDILFTRLRWY